MPDPVFLREALQPMHRKLFVTNLARALPAGEINAGKGGDWGWGLGEGLGGGGGGILIKSKSISNPMQLRET